MQNKKNNEKINVELPVLVIENMYNEFCHSYSAWGTERNLELN